MRLAVLAVFFFMFMAAANANGWRFGGHLKYQYTHTDYRSDDVNAVFGGDPVQDHELDFRVKAENRTGPWDITAHYEFLAIGGDTLQTRRAFSAAGLLSSGMITGLPDDRRRLFDLTEEIRDRDRVAAVHRLDRLSLGHSSARRVLRFGRQVISWGNGLVFHVLDFVNPFSPIAIDKDFKTGDDMFYGQWLLDGSSDVQVIVLPRRNPATHKLAGDQSSYAVKVHTRLGEIDLDLLGARHFDENLIGVGFVKSIGGAVWRLDGSVTDVKGDNNAFSLVINLDYSWIWDGKNVYGYIEYFRNGVGETDRAKYASPDPALSERINRGELFTLGRDNAALGLRIEISPLFNLFNNLIWNLNDGSIFYQLRSVYDWKQNVQIMAGINLPLGNRGDEYGGIPTAVPGTFAAPGRSVYVRVGYFF
ncbi:MAG: hypothetical protein BMS9Abin22_251 [Gammaproteobacteria bacterium]|nr:MAG: hypothetical protein BMS9Abin22_251 [Gammaproteobacteria bacterium]